jgi:predicted oxidoreductase (fatty acid repression mutant protein)
MGKSFKEAIQSRRTYYGISDKSPITDEAIEDIVKHAVTHVPSAFNSQSTRVVLLLGDQHKRLWNIVMETLRQIVPATAFASTEDKVNGFAAGHGTVLYFEDDSVVKGLQDAFPSYAANFPVWSQQTSAMHQFAIWTMLEDAGLGVNVQHYNPLIDNEVRATWNIPATWRLIAEMPFGTPTEGPGEKTYAPLDERVKIYK